MVSRPYTFLKKDRPLNFSSKRKSFRKTSRLANGYGYSLHVLPRSKGPLPLLRIERKPLGRVAEIGVEKPGQGMGVKRQLPLFEMARRIYMLSWPSSPAGNLRAYGFG